MRILNEDGRVVGSETVPAGRFNTTARPTGRWLNYPASGLYTVVGQLGGWTAWSTRRKVATVGAAVGAPVLALLLWLVLDPIQKARRGKVEYRTSFELASKKYGVPVDVIVVFISLESNFKIDEYNPEPTAIAKWSCQISGDAKWKVNPDYANAVNVCNTLKRTPGQKDAIAKASKRSVPYEDKAWKFGSFGLGQMSAITARSLGFAYARSNADLFIPEVNIDLIAKHIAGLRNRLYPGKKTLSLAEWARVRAAYVGGPGLLEKGPTKAAEIAAKFTARATKVAGVA